jgi:hypothetical protein
MLVWNVTLRERDSVKPPSAPTPQGKAGRLLVQQKEEAKERAGKATRQNHTF